MKKFHKDVYLPKVKFFGSVRLAYGSHALSAAQEDRYGDLTAYLPKEYTPDLAHVVELELEGRAIEKVVFRLPEVAPGLDLCLVVIPGRTKGTWFVKTVWANETNDAHRTLRNRSQFATSL